MPKVTKYTQAEVEEIEEAISILAQSDQWGWYVGTDHDTEEIDEMLKLGDLVAAEEHLGWVTEDRLPYHLIKVAAKARKDHLDLLGNEPGFPAKPQLTNLVTSS